MNFGGKILPSSFIFNEEIRSVLKGKTENSCCVVSKDWRYEADALQRALSSQEREMGLRSYSRFAHLSLQRFTHLIFCSFLGSGMDLQVMPFSWLCLKWSSLHQTMLANTSHGLQSTFHRAVFHILLRQHEYNPQSKAQKISNKA